MTLIILLFIAIVLQVIAICVALRLVKATKYNASWILFIIAIGIITLQRLDELFIAINSQFNLGWSLDIPHEISQWSGLVLSFCIASALLIIKKLLRFLEISEKKRNDAQDKTLNAVIAAEEAQRQMFAKELHDGLGPLLSTAVMSISAIKVEDQNQKEILQNVQNALSFALKSVKSTSGELSSHVLENFGLARAVSNIVKNIDPIKNIDLKFYNNLTNRRFAATEELVVYRVVSELINNTLKHANATLINLDIVWTGKNIEIVYSDNGVGFDVCVESIGMGLRNISSRVKSVKGEITVNSTIGNGMSVTISFPAKVVE